MLFKIEFDVFLYDIKHLPVEMRHEKIKQFLGEHD